MTNNVSKVTGFFKDKHGKWAVIEFPNALLLTWLVLIMIMMFIGDGSLKSSIVQLNRAVLFAWAYLEVVSGVSYFRRLLGGVILLSVIHSFFV